MLYLQAPPGSPAAWNGCSGQRMRTYIMKFDATAPFKRHKAHTTATYPDIGIYVIQPCTQIRTELRGVVSAGATGAFILNTRGPRSHLVAIFVTKWPLVQHLGGEAGGQCSTHREVYGCNQDSASSSVAPEVLRTSRGADAPAFFALRAPLRQTQRLSGLKLPC